MKVFNNEYPLSCLCKGLNVVLAAFSQTDDLLEYAFANVSARVCRFTLVYLIKVPHELRQV